jgi:hydrogenase-1 operon protein HyaF
MIFSTASPNCPNIYGNTMSDSSLRISLQAPYGAASEAEESCPYPAMPRMETVASPSLYGLAANAATRRFLEAISDNLAAAQSGATPASLNLLDQDEPTRRTLAEILGSGEVMVHYRRPQERMAVEESVFAGVWRERIWRNEVLVHDGVAVGPLPARLSEWAASPEGSRGFDLPALFPEGLMNAPPVLHEILAKAQDYRPGRDDIINLSLFPLTPEDSAFIEKELGFGGLQLVTRGYGECRVRLTAVPRVWWVQYFNSTHQPILNTLEITGFPQVALAAPEDLEDSGARLRDVLATLA